MMAAAEARAAWQRTANRYFVQEDAKRAPKLACCPSTSSSSKQVDSNSKSTADGSEQPTSGFTSLTRNRDLPPDTRWWLHLQPSNACQKGFFREQQKSTNKCNDDAYLRNEEDSSIIDEIARTCPNTETEFIKQELKNLHEYYEVMVTDIVGKDLCFVSESPWLGAHQKDEPWWRTADRDELASLVARKSLDHIENCDLPRPQNTHKGLPGPTIQAYGNVGVDSPFRRKWEVSVEDIQLDCSSEKPNSYNTAHKCMAETRKNNECDPSKAELLEALRRSQTRAREAEKAAKQACAEKEHIIKFFFRQASHLFAYKQWFQLLQLETIYMQYMNKEELGEVFPSTPIKTRKMRKKRDDKISKYAFVFAVGLSLVGAGLLLGWMLASL